MTAKKKGDRTGNIRRGDREARRYHDRHASEPTPGHVNVEAELVSRIDELTVQLEEIRSGRRKRAQACVDALFAEMSREDLFMVSAMIDTRLDSNSNVWLDDEADDMDDEDDEDDEEDPQQGP